MSDRCLNEDLLTCPEHLFHSSFRDTSPLLIETSKVSSAFQTNGWSWSEDLDGYFNAKSTWEEEKASVGQAFWDNVFSHYSVNYMQLLF